MGAEAVEVIRAIADPPGDTLYLALDAQAARLSAAGREEEARALAAEAAAIQGRPRAEA